MALIKAENIAPVEESTWGKSEDDDQGHSLTSNCSHVSFPEVGPEPLHVLHRIGRNQRETDIKNGCVRLQALMPFALARLGRPYKIWDQSTMQMIEVHGALPLRPHVNELARRLACGTDLVFKWVKNMCTKGPDNVVAEDLLKEATSGGKGTSRLVEAEERALLAAVEKVCVADGLKPASKAANREIRRHMVQVGGITRPISTATIKARSTSQQVREARTDAYQRDHLLRLAGQPDVVTGLNEVMVLDTTQFSDSDSELRVVDRHGRDVGPANVIFGLLKSTRGIWSFRAFAGAANGFLTGLTIKRGLVAKDALLREYSINGIWPFHGKPGTIYHDNGTEFVNDQLTRALRSRDIGFVDRGPSRTPHYRGSLERYNRTAHVLFAEFLASDWGKRYLRPVNGRPQAQGILLKDLDRAMMEWVVCHYHHRPHKGLGGDSPIARMEKYVRGLNGLPSSGLPAPLADSDELTWDFLWEETRVINHLGISFENRRYIHPQLSCLFAPGQRSSEVKVKFRFNPYAMGSVYVKIPSGEGREVVVKVDWLPENDKYRPRSDDQVASINPSLWEWAAIFKDVRRGNTERATASLAEKLFAKRENEATVSGNRAGAPAKKLRVTEGRNREMRLGYGQENLPAVG